MNGLHVNASQLTTVEGIVGHYDYFVNIQKFHHHYPSRYLKLINAVGVLVDLHYIVTACSIFYDDVRKDTMPERRRYRFYRVVADGVTGHQTEVLDARKVRFIDSVRLHPKCEKPEKGKNKWKLDLAILRTSFPFHLQPGIVGIMKFGHVPGGAKELMRNRTRDFAGIHLKQKLVTELGANSPVCQVISWGRYAKIVYKEESKARIFKPSKRLLLYKVKLADEKECEVFCDKDDRFCDLTNTTSSPWQVCAYRGNVTFISHGTDFSAFPCVGTEGSPLICHLPGEPEKADIYGIVANIPDTACVERQMPLIITHIVAVSRFVIQLVGKAYKIQENFLILVVSAYYFLNGNGFYSK